MPLTKQQVSVNFQKGLDTKTDPWQVPIGNFLSLENSVFTKQGLLQKRNGFNQIGSLTNDNISNLTTYNNNLTAVGNSVYVYDLENQTFTAKGKYQPLEFNSIPMVNNNFSQSSIDTAINPNGVVCGVYYEANRTSKSYKYVIIDSITGQSLVSPTEIVPGGGSVYLPPRVVYFNNNFIVAFPVDTAGAYSIKFISINATSYAVSAAQTIAPVYTPATTGNGVNWDMAVTDTGVAVGYNVVGVGLRVAYILPALTPTAPTTISNIEFTAIGACSDNTNAYFAYYSKVTGNGYIVGVVYSSPTISTVFAPQNFVNIPLIISTVYLINVTCSVINSTISIIYEVQSPYNYYVFSNISNLYSNLIYKRTCSTSGVLGAAPSAPLFRGVGLQSKAMAVLDKNYFVCTFDDGPNSNKSLQPSYFLVNDSGEILSRFSYPNGIGYSYYNLSSINLTKYGAQTTAGSFTITNIADTSSLNVGDRIIGDNLPVNDVYITEILSTSSITVSRAATGTTPGGGVSYIYKNNIQFGYLKANKGVTYRAYSELEAATLTSYGSMLAKVELLKDTTQSSEIGKNLFSSGGFLWNFDGVSNTENNFLLFPSQIVVEGVTNSGAVTGSVTQQIYQYQVFYEWTDNQGNKNKSGTLNVTAPVYPLTTAGAALPNVTITGNLSIGSNVITNISTFTNIQTGMTVTNANIATGSAKILLINTSTNTITISQNATANAVAASLVCTAKTANVLYIPTLRLSYKTDVTITVYRYSPGNPVFSLVSDPLSPIYNDPSVDYVTFEDKKNDDDITGNQISYVGLGEQRNQAMPPCSAFTIFDNRLWAIDSENGNTLYYSKPVLEATPVEMYGLGTYFLTPNKTLQGNSGPIKALGALDDKLIIFKPNSIYYVNGTGPGASGTNSQYSEPILISSTIGSSNPNSIAVIPNGLMVQGNKGIWLLDRNLNTSYIGAPVESLTENAIVVSAQVIPKTNQVRFSLNTGITLMYDYYYNQWGTFTNIPLTDATIYQEAHTFINQEGQVCQETPNYYLDITNPVLMAFETNWFALGGLQGYQRAYFLFLLGKYKSPHKLGVQFAYDFNDGYSQTTYISPDNYASVYGADPIFGSNEFYGGPSPVEKWRIMLTKQKCDSVRLKVTEYYDPTYGVTAGQGLTLSGMNFIIGVKKGYGPISQFNTAG
jgi:hypothetical protein